MHIHSQNAEELRALAAQFVRGLVPQKSAVIVALSGELGAGKTTFTQGVAHELGVGEAVTSPTFVIEKIYRLEGQSFERLIHIDAYRLHEAHELEVLGWHEIAADPGNVILIEWPEQVPGLIPPGAIRVRFDIDGEGRTISINGSEEKDDAEKR